MALSDIARGLEVTTEQHDRGVAEVDATGAPLADRLAAFEAELPCSAAAAAHLVETYAEGASVGASAEAAELPPVTGAKTLHLLGESVSPLGPTGRAVVRDWLAAELSRTDALALAGASETAFALAAYVETHDPLPGAREALEGALSLSGDAAVAKRDQLGDTLDGWPDAG
jgi:alkylated DNA repair dioxygenase AlkB